MKNMRWMTWGLIALLVGAPLTAVRADDTPAPAEAGMKDHHWDQAKMQKKLNLTDDQTAKMKTLHESQESAMKPLMEKERELMKKLQEQVKSKAADNDIQTTLNDLKTNRTAIRDQMEQFQTQKAGILTPTQQAEMLLMHHKRGHDMGAWKK